MGSYFYLSVSPRVSRPDHPGKMPMSIRQVSSQEGGGPLRASGEQLSERDEEMVPGGPPPRAGRQRGVVAIAGVIKGGRLAAAERRPPGGGRHPFACGGWPRVVETASATYPRHHQRHVVAGTRQVLCAARRVDGGPGHPRLTQPRHWLAPAPPSPTDLAIATTAASLPLVDHSGATRR